MFSFYFLSFSLFLSTSIVSAAAAVVEGDIDLPSSVFKQTKRKQLIDTLSGIIFNDDDSPPCEETDKSESESESEPMPLTHQDMPGTDSLVSCSDSHDSVMVSVKIRTPAEYPEKISWFLHSGGGIVEAVKMGFYDQPNHLYEHNLCIRANECIDFTIYDAQAQVDSGRESSFEVFRDDEMVLSGANFGKKLSKLKCPKLIVPDGRERDYFGRSCSMYGDIIVIGAMFTGEKKEGAAYLFNLDGSEMKELPSNNGDNHYHYYGSDVAVNEKIVVGTSRGNYFRIFSLEGIYERTISEDCDRFGRFAATYGDKVAISCSRMLYIYTTEGELLKEIEEVERGRLSALAMSDKVIVSTGNQDKTRVYSSKAPAFEKIAEIPKAGDSVATSCDRVVIGKLNSNWEYDDGAAWLYKTDGTLIKELDKKGISFSKYGYSVAITDDKVLVGVYEDSDEFGIASGSVFIYSAIDGEFIEKIKAPDAEGDNLFGISVCASGSNYIVGATGAEDGKGAVYIFSFDDADAKDEMIDETKEHQYNLLTEY